MGVLCPIKRLSTKWFLSLHVISDDDDKMKVQTNFKLDILEA